MLASKQIYRNNETYKLYTMYKIMDNLYQHHFSDVYQKHTNKKNNTVIYYCKESITSPEITKFPKNHKIKIEITGDIFDIFIKCKNEWMNWNDIDWNV